VRETGGTFGAGAAKAAKAPSSSLQDKQQKAGREKVKCKEHVEEALRKYWDHGKAPLITDSIVHNPLSLANA
jgi:hypothetical protein